MSTIFFFRILLWLMYVFAGMSVVLILRKFYEKIKSYFKTRKCIVDIQNNVAPQSNLQTNVKMNTVQFNPDLIKHTTLIIVFFIFCLFLSPLIYITYFSKSNDSLSKFDMLDEFNLFLLDLSYHIGLSIIIPLCFYVRNPDLRRFTIHSIKEYIRFKIK